MARRTQTTANVNQHLPTVATAQVAAFDRLKRQIGAFYDEISVLSKKSPDGAVNKFKLGIINEKLIEANELLGEDAKPSKQFTIFDVDNLPTNSDVVMMLSQYSDAFEAWRSGRVHKDGYDWYWNTDNGTSISTNGPTRFID